MVLDKQIINKINSNLLIGYWYQDINNNSNIFADKHASMLIGLKRIYKNECKKDSMISFLQSNFPVKELESFYKSYNDLLSAKISSFDIEVYSRLNKGYVCISFLLLSKQNNKATIIGGTIRDIDKYQIIYQKEQRKKELYELAIQSTNLNIFSIYTDKGKKYVKLYNSVFYDSEKKYLLEDFIERMHIKMGHYNGQLFTKNIENILNKKQNSFEIQLTFKINNKAKTRKYIAKAVKEDKFINIQGMSIDISLEKEEVDCISKIAFVDELTDIPNRNALLRDLEQDIKSVVCIDVDNLKTVNDYYGHTAGDTYLKKFANYLNEYCKKYNLLIYRKSGDEFVILIKENYTKEELINICKNAIKQTSMVVNILDNATQKITYSMGVATKYRNEDIYDTESRADIALLSAKANGKGQVQFATKDCIQSYYNNIEYKKALKKSITNQEIENEYIIKQYTDNTKKLFSSYIWKTKKYGLKKRNDIKDVAKEIKISRKLDILSIKTLLSDVNDICNSNNVKIVIKIDIDTIHKLDIINLLLKLCNKYNVSLSRIELDIESRIRTEISEEVVSILNNIRKLGVNTIYELQSIMYTNLHSLLNIDIDYLRICNQTVLVNSKLSKTEINSFINLLFNKSKFKLIVSKELKSFINLDPYFIITEK